MDDNIIFRVSKTDEGNCIFHSDDDRIEARDNDIVVTESNVDNMKDVITAILDDEGYGVDFEDE